MIPWNTVGKEEPKKSLDEKIVQAVIPNHSEDMPLPSFVEAIKQAFIDEGWKDWSDFKKYEQAWRDVGGVVDGDEEVMTGPEWEERAIKDGWRRPE